MVSGQISDAQISASSYADRGWVAENARLLTGRSGWTGQSTKQPFKNEWLQVGSQTQPSLEMKQADHDLMCVLFVYSIRKFNYASSSHKQILNYSSIISHKLKQSFPKFLAGDLLT